MIDSPLKLSDGLVDDLKHPMEQNQDVSVSLALQLDALLGTVPYRTTEEKDLAHGLVICYDIIQKQHGRIEVESEPGQGVAFTIWLPV